MHKFTRVTCWCVALVANSLLATAAQADPAACAVISDANHKSFSSATARAQGKVTKSGYDFAKDTPRIYSQGDETCQFLRDEKVNGELTSVYSQRYATATGSTTAEIWISKSTGLVLKEEMDGDIQGKGKGHESMTFTQQ